MGAARCTDSGGYFASSVSRDAGGLAAVVGTRRAGAAELVLAATSTSDGVLHVSLDGEPTVTGGPAPNSQSSSSFARARVLLLVACFGVCFGAHGGERSRFFFCHSMGVF